MSVISSAYAYFLLINISLLNVDGNSNFEPFERYYNTVEKIRDTLFKLKLMKIDSFFRAI